MKKLIFPLLVMMAFPTWAQRQFDIEVIVFKRNITPEQTSEAWPEQLAPISFETVGSFDDELYTSNKGVTLLPLSEYYLLDEVKRLNNHASYQVLVHTAWRQGDEARRRAPKFRFQGGFDYSNSFNPDGSELTELVGDEVLSGITEVSMPEKISELDGKLQIYVEHYLYADVQLDLKIPTIKQVEVIDNSATESTTEQGKAGGVQQTVFQGNDSASTNTSESVQPGFMSEVEQAITTNQTVTFLKSHRMNQKRRMRSTETHYLDHPLLGVIIQVRRVAQSEANQ